MESSIRHTGETARSHVFGINDENSVPKRAAKSHCWYCNKPLFSIRTYCGPECKEAMYDDTAYAKQRRMIFGCRC